MSRIRSGLPDYLMSGLSVLFVGINPGLRSVEVGHHFAGPSNRFWKLLFESGLIPSPMTYHEDYRLPEFGYGLTNLIARPTAGIQDLVQQDFLQGRRGLLAKIATYQPALIALLGISIAQVMFSSERPALSRKRSAKHPTHVGLQSVSLAGAPVFVLPNPSGRNAHYPYQQMKDLFGELRVLSRKHVHETAIKQ